MKGRVGGLFARVTLAGTILFTLLGIGTVSFASASPTVYATKNTCDLDAPGVQSSMLFM